MPEPVTSLRVDMRGLAGPSDMIVRCGAMAENIEQDLAAVLEMQETIDEIIAPVSGEDR